MCVNTLLNIFVFVWDSKRAKPQSKADGMC